MTAKIFEYKGNIGVEIDMKDGKFINDPFQQNQLGCVIDSKEVEISPSAVEFIKKARREGGSFAEFMLTKHADGSGSSIAIMGAYKVNYGERIMIGRDCSLSVLEDCNIIESEAPDDYKEYIDNLKLT